MHARLRAASYCRNEISPQLSCGLHIQRRGHNLHGSCHNLFLCVVILACVELLVFCFVFCPTFADFIKPKNTANMYANEVFLNNHVEIIITLNSRKARTTGKVGDLAPLSFTPSYKLYAIVSFSVSLSLLGFSCSLLTHIHLSEGDFYCGL